MATLYKLKSGSWRVQVCVKGERDSDTFPTRQEAATWGLQREAELGGRRLPDKTWADALRWYETNIAPTHAGFTWEQRQLKRMQAEPMARRKLAGLDCDDFAARRDARLAGDPVKGVKAVKPATVAREMNLQGSVLEHVRKPPLRWIRVNPMKDVAWPPATAARRRRVMPEEVTAVRLAFGIGKHYQGATATQRTGMAFLFALETAMRSGEICGLDWRRDVRLAQRYVIVRDTKNGDYREVPLTSAACDILRALPGDDGPVFGLDDALRDALWRKNRPAALRDLHFHDSRGEAVWRLSKKLDLLQLAQVIGHRDLKSLQHYYRATAEELAQQLG